MNTELINTIIKFIVIPLITVFGGFLVKYINVKISAAKKENEGKDAEIFNKYLDIFEKMAEKAVIATNQLMVDKLKENGLFDEEAQKEANEKAKDFVIGSLNEDMKKVLELGLSDLNKYLEALIESQVKIEKARG